MCFDNDEGDTPDEWDEGVLVCRERVRCWDCRRDIEPGESYLDITATYGDVDEEEDITVETFRVCRKCQVWRCKIAVLEIEHGCLSDYWCPIGGLRDYCRETEGYAECEPNEADIDVSLEDWKARVDAAHVAARAGRFAGSGI